MNPDIPRPTPAMAEKARQAAEAAAEQRGIGIENICVALSGHGDSVNTHIFVLANEEGCDCGCDGECENE